jgi:hypothetical protein
MRLLDILPAVIEMKRQLDRQNTAGARKFSLRQAYPDLPTAAWHLLRWFVLFILHLNRNSKHGRCVASCTAQLEELSLPEDRVIGIGNVFRSYFNDT